MCISGIGLRCRTIANKCYHESLKRNALFLFRYYILRERPTAGSRSDNIIMEDIPMSESGEGALLGLPESETDLDVRYICFMPFPQHTPQTQFYYSNFISFQQFSQMQNLTEYNTAHNRRISMLGITDDVKMKKNKNNKRKRRNVTFNDEECIINPEDIDPNVGRFRNLIQTTVVPTKRSRIENNFMGYSTSSSAGTSSGRPIHTHLEKCLFLQIKCQRIQQFRFKTLFILIWQWINNCFELF